MGENAAQTVKEIEDTRDRLEGEFRELEQRMPAPAVWTKRLIGVAVGGGVTGTAFWFAVRRLRARKKMKKTEEAHRMEAVIKVIPDRWAEAVSEALEDERWKTYAAVAGGAWLLLRLAELRQLRRMNRALIVTR